MIIMNKLSREYAEELFKNPLTFSYNKTERAIHKRGLVEGYMACAEHAIKLYDPEKMYNWLTSEKREPAQTHFTAGPERNVARELEFLLHQVSEHAREWKEKYEYLDGLIQRAESAAVDEMKQELKVANQLNKTLRDQVKQWEKVPSLKQLREENERLRDALEKSKALLLELGFSYNAFEITRIDQALNQQEPK